MRYTRTIEEKITAEKLHLDDIIINNKAYSLDITNKNGLLYLDFNGMEYQMIIDEKGISFKRCLDRPNHDYDDSESLQKVVDPEKAYAKEGELVWSGDSPFPANNGKEYLHILFGKRTASY